MRQVFEFSEEEIEAIKRDYGENPCNRCRDAAFCCGCQYRRDYDRQFSKMSDAMRKICFEYQEYYKKRREVEGLKAQASALSAEASKYRKHLKEKYGI